MAVIKEKLVITYELSIDTDTGEILSTKIMSKDHSTSKKATIADDGEDTPKLYLEENKYRLNNAAITLLGVEVGDEIDIAYKDFEGVLLPVIAASSVSGNKGNKLTKSKTVAYRGVKNEQLSKYGTEFEFKPLQEGIFRLDSGKEIEVPKDENLQKNLLEDLSDLASVDVDNEVVEVDSSIFKL